MTLDQPAAVCGERRACRSRSPRRSSTHSPLAFGFAIQGNDVVARAEASAERHGLFAVGAGHGEARLRDTVDDGLEEDRVGCPRHSSLTDTSSPVTVAVTRPDQANFWAMGSETSTRPNQRTPPISRARVVRRAPGATATRARTAAAAPAPPESAPAILSLPPVFDDVPPVVAPVSLGGAAAVRRSARSGATRSRSPGSRAARSRSVARSPRAPCFGGLPAHPARGHGAAAVPPSTRLRHRRSCAGGCLRVRFRHRYRSNQRGAGERDQQ